MRKLKEAFKLPNIATGYLYFYVHFVVEVICFYYLTVITNGSLFVWLVPFIYDAFAFVPQSIIGYFSDRFPKVRIDFIGLFLLLGGFLIFGLNIFSNNYCSLFLICLGNAFLHVAGAETTLKTSRGKLSHSAIFVAGGSFGVITGKILGKYGVPFWPLIILGLTIIPFLLLADYYCETEKKEKRKDTGFNYANPDIAGGLVVALAVLVVIVRGYMGYGLPTSWNKTLYQTIILYIAMGCGKALGGILSDAFGIKRVGIISSLLALPFLLIGDNIMLISLIGVLLFSMTMSITLALIFSALKNNPGLSFGMTTIGLFLGTVPIFFFKITDFWLNSIVIIILTILCAGIFKFIIRDDRDG